MRRNVLSAVIVALLALPLLAQERTRIDVSTLGPQVGERVPDFSLLDQHGERQTLQSLTGPRGLMLVFVRSADW
jgi:hypothetical protein